MCGKEKKKMAWWYQVTAKSQLLQSLSPLIFATGSTRSPMYESCGGEGHTGCGHIPTIAERAWGRESNFIPSLWTWDCTTLHLTEEWPRTSDPPISTSGVLMTATHYYACLCQVGDWTQGILNARQFLYPLSYSPRLKGKRDFSLVIFGLGPLSLEFFFVN